jgi:hypothetical protein
MLILPIYNIDLTGKVIVLKQSVVMSNAPFKHRVKRAMAGSGCYVTKWDMDIGMVSVFLPNSNIHEIHKRSAVQGWVPEDEAEKWIMWQTLTNENL